MRTYNVGDMIALAKRYNNNKRTYLLVNRLQGKHIPVNPLEPWALADTLAEKIKAEHGQIDVLISFAETATAIGARVASQFPGCFYLQTTRECLTEEDTLFFSEEHSHAVAQKLCVKNLPSNLRKNGKIVLLDDEVTTGKTMLNLLSALAKELPVIQEMDVICASIVDRIAGADAHKFLNNKVARVSIINPLETNYEAAVADFVVSSPSEPIKEVGGISLETINVSSDAPKAYFGVCINRYVSECLLLVDKVVESVQLDAPSKVLVLGTEEFMYCSTLVGEELLKQGHQVCVHATTRSPIGVSKEADYPIQNGYCVHSAYEKNRKTYIYNLAAYDVAVLLTDGSDRAELTEELRRILSAYGCKRFISIGC